MAKYLKPLRGKFSSATQQDILLRKGEMFLCLLNNDNMGQGPGAIYLGDGISAFNSYNHNGSTVANTPQPFLIHPAKYNPIFANSNPSTTSFNVDAATSEINNIGNGKGLVELPTVISNIKAALCKHADSINKLAADRDSMQQTIEQQGRTIAAQADTIASINGKLSGLYPVGAVYFTTINKNPNEILGYGTWTPLTAGYALKTISSGTGGSTAAAEATGGTALTSAQLPSHAHGISKYETTVSASSHSHNISKYETTISVGDHSHNMASRSVTTESGGSQPYFAYPVSAPTWPGGEQTISGCDHDAWNWETCKNSSGSSDAGGPHKHTVNIPAKNTEGGGSFSKTITFNAKNTDGGGAHSHTVSFAAKNTDPTGSGSSHSHTSGMPKSIGIYAWRRTA